MPITLDQVLNYIIPLIGQFVYSALGIGAVAGLWYYLFIVKRRRYWLIDVYEPKSDGKLSLVEKDRLVEKKVNRGKQVIYVFRKTKTESIPPPYETVQRLNGKEYADYIRVQGEYVPLEARENGLPNFHNIKVKRRINQLISDALASIRGMSAKEVREKFIYIPLNEALKYDIDFKPISYDVNMMRINEIDNLDIMFQKKKDFWDKYGGLISIGIAAVVLIVVTYMSFEYMQKVIQSSMGAADRISKPLENLAAKISGSPPAS